MENMAASIIQSLSGNPLSTPIGQKIEQATDPNLTQEDWNLNMLICDMINDTDEGPRDCVRAIRRRLQNAGKNHKVIMYTLTVLETCVKNCGRRFHLLVTNKDFVQELVKIIGPKNDPPLAIQTKVLSIIQDWTNAFRGQPDLAGVVHVYNDLKSKGIEFPLANYECQVPIHTPQRSVRFQPQVNHIPINYQQSLTNQLPTNPVQITQNPNFNFPILTRMAGPIVLNEEQLTKLKSELEIVNGNIKVFDAVLTELEQLNKRNELLKDLDKSKNNLQTEDLELLHELYRTCIQMQRRIVELLDKISNEEVTSELLTINDNLNTLFTRYQVYSPSREDVVRTENRNLNNPTIENQQQRPLNQEEASLIDLRDSRETNQLTNQLEGLKLGAVGGLQSVSSKNQQTNKTTDNKLNQQSPHSQIPSRTTKPQTGDTDFDEFAQLRSEKKVIDGVELPNEQEADEMERWLKEQNSEAPQSLSNTEFDEFLEKRFNNLEKQPPKKPDDKDLLDL